MKFIFALFILFNTAYAKENTMSKYVKEIIVYKINPEKVNEFNAIKEQMIKESYQLTGLLSSTTSKSSDEEYVYIDTMVWESKDASKKAFEDFKKLPTASQFLGVMAGPPIYQLFTEFVPDNLK